MNNNNTTAFKLPLYWLFELSLPKEFLTDIAIYFVNHLLKNNGFANQKLKPHLDKTIGINLGSNFANLILQVAKIEENDSVIFFNFRPDRAREITRTLVDPEFDGFETKKMNLYYVCFTSYDETMPNVHIAFKKEPLKNTFG